jgi:hypothetical protein
MCGVVCMSFNDIVHLASVLMVCWHLKGERHEHFSLIRGLISQTHSPRFRLLYPLCVLVRTLFTHNEGESEQSIFMISFIVKNIYPGAAIKLCFQIPIIITTLGHLVKFCGTLVF